jgi:hypothetical protein
MLAKTQGRNTNRRWYRLLVLAVLTGLCALIFPGVLAPLRKEDLLPAIIVVSVVVVAVHRLLGPR